MYRSAICLFVASVFIMLPTIAQKRKVISIKWNAAGELPASNGQHRSIGVAGAVIGIHHDYLVVAGGANFPDKMPWEGGIKQYHREGYVLGKNDSGIFVLHKTFQLPDELGYSANCSTPIGIIAAGGENKSGYTNKVLLIKWNPDSDNIEVSELPALPFAVTNASVSYYDNKLYLAGGEVGTTVSDQFLFLDINDLHGGWKTLSAIPNAVSHAVMVVQQESIFLFGGRKRNAGYISELYASSWCFDINSNRWSERKSLPYDLSAGTGVAATSNYILLFGGDKGKTFSKTESMIYSIAAEKDEKKRQELINEKNRLQAAHPGFSKEILLYNIQKNTWKKLDCVPMEVPVTTTAVLWRDEIIIPGGEIKAGVRTPLIIHGKILAHK